MKGCEDCCECFCLAAPGWMRPCPPVKRSCCSGRGRPARFPTGRYPVQPWKHPGSPTISGLPNDFEHGGGTFSPGSLPSFPCRPPRDATQHFPRAPLSSGHCLFRLPPVHLQDFRTQPDKTPRPHPNIGEARPGSSLQPTTAHLSSPKPRSLSCLFVPEFFDRGSNRKPLLWSSQPTTPC